MPNRVPLIKPKSLLLLSVLGLIALFAVLVMGPEPVHAQANSVTFSPDTVTREVDENTGANQNVGSPVTATDAEDDALTYSLGGTDASSFEIVSTSGQIQTKSGVTYDHEAKSTYTVTVTASDGNGGTDDATVTISVNDVNEPPLAPTEVVAVAVPRDYESISVRWTPPDNAGRPDITGYDVQTGTLSAQQNTFVWHGEIQNADGSPAIVDGLYHSSKYPIRVRAKNAEGDSPWVIINIVDTNFLPYEIGPEPQIHPLIVGSGLGVGDSFRLLFVSSNTIRPTDKHLYEYIDQVKNAGSQNELFAYQGEFAFLAAVLSTRRADARVVSNTTYTDDDKGVPIYWVGGSKVADDYEDFYDGSWDDETNVRDESGTIRPVPNGVWTGSASDGTELIEGGVSRALGQDQVGYGAPGSTASGAGPLHSGSTAASTEERPLYGLSPVYRIIAPGLVSNLGQSGRTTDERSARRSQRFTTGSHLHGYNFGGVQVVYDPVSDTRPRMSISIYTVDSNGHPDSEVAAITYPDADALYELTFDARAGTILDPDTTYAIVVSPSTPGTDLGLRITSSNGEDSESEDDWSLADAFDIESSGSWQADTAGNALRVRVRGTPKVGPPAAPTSLTATAVGRHRIDLSWTGPSMDGGSSITGYRIESSADGLNGWSAAADTGSTATAYSHTGLRPETTLHYRVSAINAEGASAASDTANATTADYPEVEVQFGQGSYTVAEGATRSVTVTLSEDPLRTTVIPLSKTEQGGATSVDYSGVPSSLTFNSGETSRSFTFTATQDTLDDDGESVLLAFGALPPKVSEGTRGDSTVSIIDDDDPEVSVQFAQAGYTVAEGSTQMITVTLSADPERTVVIRLTKTEQGGVFPTDYSGVPSRVTFNSGQTSRTFTFTAAQDDEDDDGESVKLEFGPLPARVSEGTTDETTVTIGDDDDPRVTVGFGAYTYEIAEGSTRVFIVALNVDPERTISVPVVVAANQGGATSADYSGVPTSVTFNAGQTSRPFTFNATDDTVDDDGESVKLGFGTLPPRVSLGARNETTVSITDDDDPEVTVAFVQDAYRVVEGRTVTVRITLSADPERTVAIPLSKTEQNGASSADYSGVPASVTFNSGETSKTFDFVAADDTLSDTGESVKLTFGGLPDRVSEGTPAETTVTIRQVSAQFQLDCSQAEWCADLKLDDYTAVDWGWSQLQYNGSFSPPANLSVKSFIFRGVEYTIRAVYVVPGIYPEIDNAYNRVQRGQGEFLMSISHGETWEAAPEGHYQDWELHIGGVVLPFGEAALWEKRWFLWYGLEFQEIFTDWTSSTVNKIGIREIPSVQHLPTVPPAPAYVSAAAQEPDGLRVSWRSPWTRQRNQAITGYIVQWKQASHSWSDSPRVSSMSVGPKSISAQVNGLTEGVLYTVRVIATNAVGDGPPSEDAIGRPQPQLPHLVSAVVNGPTLTLRYNRELDMNSVPEKSAFIVIAGQGLREVRSVSISGMEVTLTLARAVTSVDRVQAAYVAPATASATFLRDREGNHVYTLGGDLPSVTNETDPALLQPLTARFTNVPASHDGEASFPFNIEFNESVWIDVGLGKDDLLNVSGGTVTAAHWLDRRTEEWRVTIQPSSDADVVVVLPGGRRCSVEGAPCAAGNRVLSGEKTVTITGPTSQQQAPNSPATGAPTINGTARVGDTLTANTTGIADSDGVVNVSFTYQWLADDTEISGATGSTHTVTNGDVGKAIRVRVSFTDDAGNAESLTSAATAAVALPALRLQTPAVDGATLTLTYNNDLDEGVTLPTSAFTVTVASNTRSVSSVSVSGRAVTLTLASAVASGEAVTVSYTRPDGPNFIRGTQGSRAESFSDETATNNTADSTDTSQRSDTSEQEAQVPGTPQNLRATTGNSEELAVSWDAPSSDGGSEITGYKVQWKASSGSWDTLADVSETTVTATAHTITGLTDGTEYDVQVLAVNSEGAGEASSGATATPVNPTPLTATTHDAPSSHDGTTAFTFELRLSEEPKPSFSYTTMHEHAFTVTGGSVTGARRLNPPSNVGWEITVQPSGNADVTVSLPATTDCSAEGAICTSDGRMLSGGLELVVPGPPSNSVATGAPTIGGTAQVGETLAASTSDISDADGLANATFTYQWLADDAVISDATGSTYTLADADAGKAIRVRVSFTDDAGNAETLTSAATTAVTPPALRLQAAAVEGATLTVTFSESLDEARVPAKTAFTVTVGGNDRRVDTVAVSGSEVAITLVVAAASGETVTVSYTAPAGESADGLRDQAGNAAASFSGRAVTNGTRAADLLTASVSAVPESHDGHFTFELRFSEEPKPRFSYETLRDHAFTVTGGAVTKARRLNAPSNIRWEIHIMPDSAARLKGRYAEP